MFAYVTNSLLFIFIFQTNTDTKLLYVS